MATMQTQALYAVLRDFDLANSRRGLLVDEAASLCAKLGLRFPRVRNRVRPPVTDVFCDGGRTQGAGTPPEQDAQGRMVPCSPSDRASDHGGDAEGTGTFVTISCQSNHMKWNASMISAGSIGFLGVSSII